MLCLVEPAPLYKAAILDAVPELQAIGEWDISLDSFAARFDDMLREAELYCQSFWLPRIVPKTTSPAASRDRVRPTVAGVHWPTAPVGVGTRDTRQANVARLDSDKRNTPRYLHSASSQHARPTHPVAAHSV